MGIFNWGNKRDLLAMGSRSSLPSYDVTTWQEPAPLTALALSDLYGTTVNMPITRKTAMAIPAVAKARNLICSKVAGFPLVAMTGTAPTPRPSSWLQNLEAGRPNFITLTWIVDGLIFYGRAFLRIAKRGTDGRPTAFEFIPEWRAGVQDGLLVQIDGKEVNPNDSIRIDAHHEGILEFGRDALRAASDMESAALRTAHNPVPTIELHQESGDQLTDEEIKELVDHWTKARRDKNGAVGYTNQSVSVKVHGVPAEQLMISGRNTAALNIARIFGISAWAVDATVEGSSLTYSSVPARSRELVEYGLKPYMDAITARLSMDDLLPNGQWCRFDTSQLLRESFSERMNGYKTAKETGIYTTEELQKLEQGIPLEGQN